MRTKDEYLKMADSLEAVRRRAINRAKKALDITRVYASTVEYTENRIEVWLLVEIGEDFEDYTHNLTWEEVLT